MYKTYSQDRAHIPGTQTPAPHRTTQELIQRMAEAEDKPVESNYTDTDPLGPAHDPYKAGYRGKSKRLSE